jgi:hypothetical protein
MMRSTRIKVDKDLSLSTEVFDHPFFNSSLGIVTLFQVPIPWQGEVKVNMMAGAGTPRPQVMQVDPFWSTNVLERIDNATEDALVSSI